MRTFGLIGYPLTQSFSYQYFQKKFLSECINDSQYLNFPIRSIEDLPALISSNPDLAGLNVTIPYKEQVLQFLDVSSAVVQSIGACNCINIISGRLHGYNSDVIGFELSLKDFIGSKPLSALILGTGGSSKAVGYVLNKMEIPFYFVSRTPLGGQLGYDELNAEIITKHQLIINTTPLGMYPVEAFPSIPYEFITPEHYFFDLIYNPPKTSFLLKAEQMGASIKNGEEMLQIQAEESWRIWNE